MKRQRLVAICGSAAVFVLSVVVGMTQSDSLFAEAVPRGESDLSFMGNVVHILVRNIPTMLFLYSGVVTFGVSTLIGLFASGLFMGISMNVAASAHGVGEVIVRTGLYTPLEVTGFVLGGAAGLLPVVSFLLPDRSANLPSGRVQRLAETMTRSFRLLLVAAVVLVIGSVVEAAVIVL